MHNDLFDIQFMDIMQDGFLTLNTEWNFVFINQIAADIANRNKNELLGKNIWHEVPQIAGSDLEKICRGVMNDKIVKRIELKGLKTGNWYNIVIFPTGNGISVYLHDITKEKQTEEALKLNEQQLKSLVESLNFADQSKTAFIATLSHELRNPMASIMLGTSLLRQDPLVGKFADKAIDIIERQSTQLDNLVSDLLDVTRITQNKMSLNKTIIDLRNLMGLILRDYEDRFRSKGIDFEVEYSKIPLSSNLDIARFNQVISNLLENSLKFTESGGRVSVSLEPDETETNAVITITDNGIGIKPEIQKQLFKPFVQADLSLNRGYGGLGLGLVIVKGIVEMHGGNVNLYSEGEGKGTKFEITLPVLTEPNFQNGRDYEQTVEEMPVGFKILVIDDVQDLTEILSEVIKNLGHQVVVAYDGPQGIAMARKNCPDVLICDIGLPGMNGYEVAEAFREDPELKNTFLIALSGYAQPEDLAQSRKAGFHLHLVKPVNLDKLKMALAEAYFYTNRPNKKI